MLFHVCSLADLGEPVERVLLERTLNELYASRTPLLPACVGVLDGMDEQDKNKQFVFQCTTQEFFVKYVNSLSASPMTCDYLCFTRPRSLSDKVTFIDRKAAGRFAYL